MVRTTPQRPVDLTALFPELTGYARTATRLHPRAGSPTVHESSVGGPPLWPAHEPWPACPDKHQVRDSWTIPEIRRMRAVHAAADEHAQHAVPTDLPAGATTGPGPQPLIALAQLYARDIPGLNAPPGTDLLQVLWCPFDHAEGPATTLRWRQASAVDLLLDEPPQPTAIEYPEYLPEPCVLHPEQITEYPRAVQLFEELDPDLCEHIAAWSRQVGGTSLEDSDAELPWVDADRYDEISATATWKTGGWPFWSFRDPWPIRCTACNATMTPPLQIGSGEWFDDLDHWTPVEDLADIHAASLAPHTHGNPPQVSLAHGYRLQIYVCPDSADHPHQQLLV